MQVPQHIFREYDVRGLVEQDLELDVVRAIGRGYATFLARKIDEGSPTVALGRDVRPSSDPLRVALVEGLMASGAKVMDIGVVPTPVLYFACHHLETDGGVMITGSHNPPEYNGFKLGYRDLPFSGAEIQEVRKLIEADNLASTDGTIDDAPVTQAYCDMVASKVRVAKLIRVALDPANATGALFAGDLLERLGVTVDRLFDEVDGTFPNHHPDPTVDKNVVALQKRVVEIGADLGIGLDGDCDRIGAIDENGRLVRGDQLTAVFARDQLEKTPGERILFDVKSSLALEEDIRAHGGRPVMWKTGHSLAKKKMHEDGIPLGGEMSGHLFFFHDYYGFDDAIFAACRLCEIVARSDQSLGAMVDSLTPYVSTPEIRIDTTEEAKWQIVERARKHFGSRYPIVDIDGVRVTFPRGWALLRASNTQPVIVARAEGRTADDLAEIVKELESFLRAQGIQISLEQ
ncbi:MAG: phosphomannomutase/phosphoglucomutase [Gemmatimonadota bacterium]